MKKIQIRPIDEKDRDWVIKLLNEEWGSALIVAGGKKHFADRLPGYIAEMDDSRAGLLTYEMRRKVCGIISLNSLQENNGIGTLLIDTLVEKAIELKCGKIILHTTNDNLHALRFYQKRNFRIVGIFPDAVVEARKIKPSIPLIGQNGIPVRDEIKLELVLGKKRNEKAGVCVQGGEKNKYP